MSGVPKAADPSADEARLAQEAAAGNGEAFAELYERYERRAYNLCYRILGSEDDAADATQEAFVGLLRRLPGLEGRDLAFGSYLFTSARNACYDLIERRRRAEPSDEIPESSIPVGGGVGGGGFGFDPGDPEDDPERNVLLDARQEEIRAANSTLPERQREALALKELEELSYDEIAVIMGMNRNSVAQLISRARINLRDALRGSALASIAAASPECERALALAAAGQDAQPAADAAWLELHLHDCETCRLCREAMEEAGVSYRAWLPIAAGPVLFRETMAEAAEAVGADWSDVVARRQRARRPRRPLLAERILAGARPPQARPGADPCPGPRARGGRLRRRDQRRRAPDRGRSGRRGVPDHGRDAARGRHRRLQAGEEAGGPPPAEEGRRAEGCRRPARTPPRATPSPAGRPSPRTSPPARAFRVSSRPSAPVRPAPASAAGGPEEAARWAPASPPAGRRRRIPRLPRTRRRSRRGPIRRRSRHRLRPRSHPYASRRCGTPVREPPPVRQPPAGVAPRRPTPPPSRPPPP